jgi:cobalt/nickel transport system permease protein
VGASEIFPSGKLMRMIMRYHHSVHIAEGYLPLAHAAFWTLASAPFVLDSYFFSKRRHAMHPEDRLLLGASGAFAFTVSALKIPSLAGSSSHATGVGLGAVLMGPRVMSLLGTLVLLFQALLLGHGGLTTLGANVFAAAIVGPWVSFAVFRLLVRAGEAPAAGVAAAMGDLATYATTAFQLAAAFPDATEGIAGSFVKFAAVFGITQIPLAIGEGLLTAVTLQALRGRSGSREALA